MTLVVVTGVSPNSLGETLALTIARHCPAKLILASRTKAKLEQVALRIADLSPDVKPILIELDLSNQEATRRAAAETSSTLDHIDILLNTGGVVTSERQVTSEGIELQFGTNHLGHFLFTSLLTPLLLAGAKQSGAGTTRVVNVSSLGYRLSPLRFHDYNFEGEPIPLEEEPPAAIPPHLKPDPAAGRPYAGFTAYGQSKTANILHAVSLNKKLGSQGVKAFAVHPGSIWTRLSRNLTPEDAKVIEGTSGFWKSRDQGVATILVAALDPELLGSNDLVMLSDCQLEDVATYAKDPKIAEHLWELSESLTAER
ncbi:hypothetical protein LTR08_000066 [Meristemomyces frigidus]|nr:hypothetical protein LTR08_000066 [Meristemomyces frigidus]